VHNYTDEVFGDIEITLGNGGKDVIKVIPPSNEPWERIKCVYDEGSIKESSLSGYNVRGLPNYVEKGNKRFNHRKGIDENTSQDEILYKRDFYDWDYLYTAGECEDRVGFYWVRSESRKKYSQRITKPDYFRGIKSLFSNL